MNWKEDILKAFELLPWGDTEVVHSQADDLLLDALTQAGHPEIAEAFRAAEKRENGFWYA